MMWTNSVQELSQTKGSSGKHQIGVLLASEAENKEMLEKKQLDLQL